jgi:sigma-B regulation protein RsbU (phosphoserine phosphatase)
VVRIVLADATGHDERSAEVIAFLRPLLERDLGGLNERAFRRWNQALYERFENESLFACFTAIELDRSMNLLKIAIAGNPDLIIRRADNSLDRLASTGMPLGLVPGEEWVAPTLQYARLRPGDCAVCFSDGLVDRIGPNGDRFGLERVCLAARAGGRRLLRVLRSFIRKFSSSMEEQDDLSVVLLWGAARQGAT